MTANGKLRIDIDQSRSRFEFLLGLAEDSLDKGRYIEAASYVQVAAASAWSCHPGIFHSSKAEDLLTRIAAEVPALSANRARSCTGKKTKVLHVLTQSYQVGGHTRLVWRWIEADDCREHHVALTQQEQALIPSDLIAAATKSGGKTHILDKDSKDLVSIAVKLKELLCEFNFVVLHIHPHDVVPVLALAAGDGHPATIFVNHADHVFWIGGRFCDVVANLRESGTQLSLQRRCLAKTKNTILPIPLAKAQDLSIDRLTARRNLSMDVSDYVAVSVATSSKFQPLDGADFCEIHYPLVCKHNKFRILVIGPSPEEAYWKAWSTKTNGRMRAVGIKDNTDEYLAAADVYLDSMPFCSPTSLLEAALRRLPCVSWRPYPSNSVLDPLTFDNVSLDGLPTSFSERERYLEHIESILLSPSKKAALGDDYYRAVMEYHVSHKWNELLEETYARSLENALERKREHETTFSPAATEFDHRLNRFQNYRNGDLARLNSLLPFAVRLRYLLIASAPFKVIVRELMPATVLGTLRVVKAGFRRRADRLLNVARA